MEKLKDLDAKLNQYFQIDLILYSLSDSYRNFISKFYINKIECSLAELMNILIATQGNMKTSTVMAMSSSSKTRPPRQPK